MAQESSYAPKDRLVRGILGIHVSTSKETYLKLPISTRGQVIDVRWVRKKGVGSLATCEKSREDSDNNIY